MSELLEGRSMRWLTTQVVDADENEYFSTGEVINITFKNAQKPF